MSREVDPKAEDLSPEDATYLAQRDQLPPGHPSWGQVEFFGENVPKPYVGDVGTVPEILPDNETGEPVVINPANEEYLVHNAPPSVVQQGRGFTSQSQTVEERSLEPGTQAGDAVESESSESDSEDAVSERETVPEAPEEDVPPYEQWELPELRKEAAARGLSEAGTKPQIVKRLEKHDAEAEDSSES